MSLETTLPSGAHPARRDNLPPWVIVLLAIFLVVRLYDVAVAPFLNHKSSAKTPAAQGKESGGMDDDAMQDLLQADLQAKSAFATTLAQSGTVVRPDVKMLRQALQAAEDLQRDSGNSPGAARRLILLRALVNEAAPGSKSVTLPLAVGKHGLDPLAAFTTALPADLPPADRAAYTAEARLWQTVFRGGALSPHQIADLAVRIRHLPNIRWWQYPALMALYTGQGDLSEAGRYARAARDASLTSVVPFGLIGLVRFALILLGVVLLISFVVRSVQSRSALRPLSSAVLPPQSVPQRAVDVRGGAASPESVWPPIIGTPISPGGEPLPAGLPRAASPPLDLWPTVPPAIPDAERRLGAGDLMGIFVIYLVTREVIGFLLTGFSGFDLKYLPHFHGLLAPFRPGIERMPAAQRTTVGIVLESAVYLLSAVPPFAVLWGMARRRGASLADEIGWTRRRLGLNIVYGVGGFAVASALMLPVALVAKELLRHAPDPSNPVIPQLINTSGFWGPFLLVALASFAAPVVEEVLFRGVFYNAAKLRLGVWPAIVLTGLVFGFVHPVGIAGMLAIGTLGGVFAWMAETRKSLAPSMFAHFLQNFTTTLLLLVVLAG